MLVWYFSLQKCLNEYVYFIIKEQQYLSIYLKENVSCTLFFAGYFFWRAETYTSLFRWQTWRSDNHVYLTISMYWPLEHFMWFIHSSWSYVKTKAALQVAVKSYAWTTRGFLPNHTCDCPSFIFVISIWEMVGVCVCVCASSSALVKEGFIICYIVCALSRTISTFSRLWVSKDWFLNFPLPQGLGRVASLRIPDGELLSGSYMEARQRGRGCSLN